MKPKIKPFTFLQKMRRAWAKFLFFILLPQNFIRSNNVAMEHNVLRLGDVQPCSKFQFSTNAIGCILPNRCYMKCRLICDKSQLEY